MRALATIILLAGALIACARTPGAGAERGACRPDRTCDGRLVCLSDVCVRPPAGDCGQVGEALASTTLGNYAPAEQRAPEVAKWRAACEREGLSIDEASCLTAAKSKFELSRCPRPLVPELVAMGADKGGCTAVGAKLEQLAKAELAKNPGDELAKVMPQVLAAAVASCHEDGWPDEVKACFVDANPADDRGANACIEKMPREVSKKFEARIEAIVAGVAKARAPQPPPPAPPPAPIPSPANP